MTTLTLRQLALGLVAAGGLTFTAAHAQTDAPTGDAPAMEQPNQGMMREGGMMGQDGMMGMMGTMEQMSEMMEACTQMMQGMAERNGAAGAQPDEG